MRIKVNGQWQDSDGADTVAALLERLGLEPRRVAIERNRSLLPRARYGQTALAEEDEFEIVTLVGGG